MQLVSEPAIRVSGWDQFDEVVLVATSAERTGSAYQHLFTAQFDSGLTDPDQPAALATLLKPNYPNPFRPSHHSHTLGWLFDLAAPSRPRPASSIFSANGAFGLVSNDLGRACGARRIQRPCCGMGATPPATL